MKQTLSRLSVLVVIVSVAAQAGAVEPLIGAGEVDAVTVYRGQALVTRVVEVPGPAGLREVLVTDLPQHIVPNSIYAESANGLEVRSVSYRERPVSEDVREEVRELDVKIRDFEDQLRANQAQQKVVEKQRAYLDKLEQFSATTSHAELSSGVLNAQTLKDLTEYVFSQRSELVERELALATGTRDLSEQLDLVRRHREKITGASSRTMREAVVYVHSDIADGSKLRLRYMVNQAGWEPSYTARRDGDAGRVALRYLAMVHQSSGEDWKNASLTLSTATPSLTAISPTLIPMEVTLTSQQTTQQAASAAVVEQQQRELAVQLWRGNVGWNYNHVTFDKRYQNQKMNSIAGQIQNMELNNAFARVNFAAAPSEDRGFCVTYELSDRLSLPSRADRQLIQIASLTLDSEYYKIATPVLTPFVYNEASVTNGKELVLLAGPIASYANGQFVGHGRIATVAAGERFTVGFGIDSTLRASRQLVEREESIQGGNRVIDFAYRLSMENFGGEPATVRVMDRLPMAKESQVRLELAAEVDKSLSRDAEYRSGPCKNGILRWQADVPAHATGANIATIDYQFRLEHDRQMTIGGLAMVR